MARETPQHDKRTQSKSRNASTVQSAQSSRSSAVADRQTPIQSGREETRPSARSQPSQPSGAVAQSGNAARPGMTAPLRGGMNGPFELMQRMSQDMDRLFEQLGFSRMGFGLGATIGSLLGSDVADRLPRFNSAQHFWAPQIETAQRGDRFVVRADLPGINKDDVHVEVEDDVLTISGERTSEQRDERDGFYRSERSYGSFYRAIPLPEGVNADRCEAKFSDGVLEISLPSAKTAERKTRKVQIR